MTSRTHDAIAFASLITVAAYIKVPPMNLLTAIGAVIACDIGAAIPDMDTAGNRLWEMLPQGHKVGEVLRNIFYKHRTFTHSLVGAFAFYKLLEWILPKILNASYVDPHIILWATMIGIASHLVSDSFTEEGIPIFFPLKFAFGIPPVKQFRITTGQWVEHIIVYPGVWIYLGWFIYRHEAVLRGILRTLTK